MGRLVLLVAAAAFVLSAAAAQAVSVLFMSYSLSPKHLQNCLSWLPCVLSWQINSPGGL